MEIVKIRIDDRLIHGQVAAVWSLITQANRIVVVDDEVVKDSMNKEALKMACPSRCKLSIITTRRACENLLSQKYDGERIFIVVKKPETICKMITLGYIPTEVNVGNMGGKAHTKMLFKAVNVSENDVKDFRFMIDRGVKVFAQMVPNDEPIDIATIL